MKLVPVRGNPDAAPFLYELLGERPRENFISHEQLPARDEHEEFVAEHPFRYWYLVSCESGDGNADDLYVGAVEVTDRNEIGVSILKRHQRRGYGSGALELFMATHEPLPPIKAIRNGHWLANIAQYNIGSKLFFAAAGFQAIQETWRRP